MLSLFVANQAIGPGRWIAVGFSVVFLVPVVHFLLEEYDRERTTTDFGRKASLAFEPLVGIVAGALVAYILVWVLGDGLHFFSGEAELVIYSLIDLVFVLGVSFRLSEIRPTHGSSPHSESASAALYDIQDGYGSTMSIQI